MILKVLLQSLFADGSDHVWKRFVDSVFCVVEVLQHLLAYVIERLHGVSSDLGVTQGYDEVTPQDARGGAGRLTT